MAAEQIPNDTGPLEKVYAGVRSMPDADAAVATEERRQAPRRRLSIPVWIRVITGSTFSPAQARQLVDISATGLGFISKSTYKVGQSMMVELCINNTTWSGPAKVVHCTEHAGGYKIGVMVTTSSQQDLVQMAIYNTSRKPTGARDLKQLQEQIPKAMRAYRQARASWGLLGTPIKKNIMRIISRLPMPSDDEHVGESHRRHKRFQMEGDVHLVVPTYYGGKWLWARILDISEGGAGLSIPWDVRDNDVERVMSGDFRLAPKVPVIVGIGNEPHTVWLPAEITHCSPPQDGLIRVGVAFNTPTSQAAFGA